MPVEQDNNDLTKDEIAKEQLAAVIRNYKKLQESGEEEIDYYINKNKNDLINLLKNIKGSNKSLSPESMVLKMLDKQLAGNFASSPIDAQLPNSLLLPIQRLGQLIYATINTGVMEEFSLDGDVKRAVNELLDLAGGVLKGELSSLLPAALTNGELVDIQNGCMNLINSATVVRNSYRKYKAAKRMSNIEHWLESQCAMRDYCHTEMANLEKERMGMNVNSVSPERYIDKFKLNDISLNESREVIVKKLCFDDEFRQLTDSQQRQLLIDIRLIHLRRLLSKCEEDVLARLNVDVSKSMKDRVKKIIINNYTEYDGHVDRNKLIANVNHPKPELYEERSEEIRLELEENLRRKKNKFISRLLIAFSVVLSLTLAFTVMFAAPPLVLVFLAAGVISALLLAKIFHKDDSLLKVSQKGSAYIIEKAKKLFIMSNKNEEKKPKEFLVSRGSLIAKRLFDQHEVNVEKMNVEKSIQSDAEKLVENMTNNDGNDEAKLSGFKMNGKIISNHNVFQLKNDRHVGPLIKSLQRVENAVFKYYSLLSFDKLKAFSDQVMSYAKNILNNNKFTPATNITSMIDLAALARQCKQVVFLGTYVVSSAAKWGQASKMLKFDYWLKRRLVDRFNMQLELAKLNDLSKSYLANHQNKLNESMLDAGMWYDKLFSKIDDNRQFNQLSLKKIRLKLEKELSMCEEFLRLSESQQLYLIGVLEAHHLNNKIAQCESDILVRAKVKMNSKKYANNRHKFAKHIENNYLGYEQGTDESFKSKLINNIIHSQEVSSEEISRNLLIEQEFKANFNVQCKKLLSRVCLLLFAGLALAALVAGFALAPPLVIGPLLVGALLFVIAAKLIRKEEGVNKVIAKGFGNLAFKVNKQFTLWGTKEKMKSSASNEVPEKGPIVRPGDFTPSGA